MAYPVKANINGRMVEGTLEANELIEELEKVVEDGKEKEEATEKRKEEGLRTTFRNHYSNPN